MNILDLGCGTKKVRGSIGLDVVKHKSVDVVHDLTKFPYPFEDNKFDIVIANHILEHIEYNNDFFNLMREVHRILKPNGIFKIEVPYRKGRFACSNPEHTRFFQIGYFDYFKPSFEQNTSHLSNKAGVCFRRIHQELAWISQGKFLNVLKPLYNLYHPFSELILSNFIPPDVVRFELEVLK